MQQPGHGGSVLHHTGGLSETTGNGDGPGRRALAAVLEVLAVQTYTAALDAATTDKLGEVPPPPEYVTTALAHHNGSGCLEHGCSPALAGLR